MRDYRGAYSFIVAAVGVLVVFAVRYALDPILGVRLTTVIFLLPTILASWYGGLWPGLVAAVSGLLLSAFFFVDPEGSLMVSGPAEWINVALYLLVSGALLYVFEALKGTEVRLERLNAELEQIVSKRTEQVRSLAVDLSYAEEKERSRIAKLIHDDLQQLVVALRYRIHEIRKDFQGGDLHDELEAHLQEAEDQIGEAIRTVRTLSSDIHPPISKADIGGALEWLAGRTQDLHGLSVALDIQENLPRTREPLGSLLFDAAKELLFNVAKHSGTRESRIELRADSNRLTMTVKDAGKGCPPHLIKNGTGSGLSRIGQRLELFGGRMDVESEPGKGMQVTIAVPLDRITQESTPAT